MINMAAKTGTWIAKKDVIAAKRWDDIEKNAAEVVKLVAGIRGGSA